MSEANITILCTRPGMRRAGMSHPAKASYPADELSAKQLEILKADPAFQVVEGEVADKADGAAGVALEAASAKISKLEGDLATKAAAAAKLEGDLATKETEISTLKADAAQSTKESKALEAKVKKLEADLAKANTAAKK